MKGLRSLASISLIVSASCLAVSSTHAAECHAKPVHAKDGAGLFEATAKSRARSAWIKKVRSDRRLGRDYASWLRARDPSYACRKVGRRVVCDATATPCRLEPAKVP